MVQLQVEAGLGRTIWECLLEEFTGLHVLLVLGCVVGCAGVHQFLADCILDGVQGCTPLLVLSSFGSHLGHLRHRVTPQTPTPPSRAHTTLDKASRGPNGNICEKKTCLQPNGKGSKL